MSRIAPALHVLLAGSLLLGLSACSRCGGGAAEAPLAPQNIPHFGKGKDKVSLLFVGDMSVARGITDRIEKRGSGDPAWPFELIRPTLEKYDLVFANLECVVSDSTAEEATSKTYRIRAATKYATKLKEVGIDVISVANNHAMDFGAQGFNSTLAQAHEMGLVTIGSQDEAGWAQKPVIVPVGELKVGFLGYNQHGDEYKHADWRPSSARYKINEVVEDVRRARPLVDILVVSVHGGPELSHTPWNWQERDSRAVIDAGADMWIGHHPHVAQPYLQYKNGIIVYSLGDFLFDKNSPWLVHRNKPRLFLEVNLDKSDGKGRIASWRMVGGDQDVDYRPLVDEASFDVESFREQPRDPAVTLSALLPKATVERLRGKEVEECDRWEKHRMPISGHAFRWLQPRWGCDGDSKREMKTPWRTVAVSAEVLKGSLKTGIWAHPHAGGPLRLSFHDVPLQQRLVGFSGVPDWGVVLSQKQKTTVPPVKVTITIGSGKGAVKSSFDVPYIAGVFPLEIDTSAFAGKTESVVVEIEGGTGDKEGRFLFDLAVRSPMTTAN